MIGRILNPVVVMCLLIGLLPFTGMNTQTVKAKQDSVQVWLTTANQSKLLSREPDLNFETNSAPNETTINVNEKIQYQKMKGFGASMTDSSAWLIENKLTTSQRDNLMKGLFDHEKGIGISYVRLPMGATDFSLDNYTYNDLPEGQTDPEMNNFSIKYARSYIIPALQKAKAINPELKIMGTPWSAPAWMKTTGTLNKGKLKEDAYQAYALYFKKFIEAYEKEGLPIDAITVQNEPHHETPGYPSMRMEASEQANFIKNHLGPVFEENNVDTKIIAWDHNWDEYDYPIEVLNDPEAKKYIAGSAFHGYAGNVQNQQYVKDAHPEKDIYFTESSGGEWATDFGGNLQWDLQNLIIGATRNWAKTVLKWNIALDESFGPTNGGCSNCRGIVTIDQETGKVTKNVEYYAFGHASKFVMPGAHRIASNTFGDGNIENVAFKNPDGSKVLIALNSSKKMKDFKVRSGKNSFSYTLPAGAAATFVWSKQQAGEKLTSPYSKIEAEDYHKMFGVQTEITTDAGGGKYVGKTDDNDYLLFKNVEFVDGTVSLDARVSAEGNGKVEFRTGSKDGTLIGSLNVSNTGGQQSWKTKSTEITGASGVQDVYVVFKGSVNLNWFQFSKRFWVDSFNYLSDNGDFEQGNLTNWSGWNPEGQPSAQKIDTDGPRGKYKLTHWSGNDYMQTTYRTVQVPNGTYQASIWVRKDTGNKVRLEVKKYGGTDLFANAGIEGIGDWKKITIDGIRVTNGQVEIGIFSDSPAGKWAAFDDVELHPMTTVASGTSKGENSPSVPVDLVSTSKEVASIDLSWKGTEDVDGYVIYRSVKTNGVTDVFSERTIVDSNALSYADKGLQGGVNYCYRVSAFNESGESAAGEPVCAITVNGQDSESPAAPTGVRAMPGIEKITLYWNHNVEKDFLQYNIYQDGVLIGSIDPVTTTTYTIENIPSGKTYQFEVTAVDMAGNESPLSDGVNVSPIPQGTPVKFLNSGFEVGTLEGWSEWHPDGQEMANFVDTDFPHEGGEYKLTHWQSTDYKQTTYRTLQVPNGTYRLTVWARTGGGQNTFRLEVGDYGGEDKYADMRSAEGGRWMPFTIDPITVTNGQLKIGVYSDAKAGNWAAIDDFELVTYEPVSMD
ncbi:carbohydrate-binding protein [Neobacillus niacini]|uniref:carbohydrate-binding protein n=1 Tax=Neobacillus niacini TaxID=86668 RepID=UPI0039836BE9